MKSDFWELLLEMGIIISWGLSILSLLVSRLSFQKLKGLKEILCKDKTYTFIFAICAS